MRDVSKAAQQVLGIPPGNARDAQYKLSAHQCNEIERAMNGRQSRVPVEEGVDQDADTATDPIPDPPMEMRSDPKAERGSLEFSQLNLWVHQDILEKLERWGHLRKSSGAVVQRLAAHGRTSVVKGCKGEGNRGWRRSPLGGNGGMQFYLWWTVHGSGRTESIEGLKPGEVVVRDIRHHDDHGLLAAGDKNDYLPGQSPQDIEDEIGSPWTEEQLDFVNDNNPVRLVHGQPGSGKTTALWKAVEARTGQRVLYLTWSRELTDHAREHFVAFAPRDVYVKAYDFATFLGEICGTDIDRQAVADSRATFNAAVADTQLGATELGVWRGREDALFAEVRAELLGGVVPGESDCAPAGKLTRLSDRAYRDRRIHAIGRRAAASVLKIFKALDPGTLERVFPELAAATVAVDVLRDESVPDGLVDFDRIVVDEVQDLTLLETSVIVEHCRAIAHHGSRAPWLLFAGDDGQTVRPSGFDWGAVNDLLARKVYTPKRFRLEGNLRCPSRIADVIDRASERYVDLGKPRRPTKQQRQAGGRDLDAELFHVAVSNQERAGRLLEELKELEDVVVVSPEPDPPDWVPEHVREAVLTPVEAKGLEYQVVCVLDPGRFLLSLGAANEKGEDTARLEEHVRRTAIDRLRVALSRPTETLAFVDVTEDEAALRLSRELLGDAARYEDEDLVEHLADDETTVEERVERCIEEARGLADNRPARAWQRADQAVKLLGNPDLPNGVSDEELRDHARTTLLATAARLLVDGIPEGVTGQDIGDAARSVVADPESPASGATKPDPLSITTANRRAFDELEAWSGVRDRVAAHPFGLLNATLALGAEGEWLRSALPPVVQTLRAAIQGQAGVPDEARHYVGNIEGWLELTGYPGNVVHEARRLRAIAVDALIPEDTAVADQILAKIVPEEARLTARVREAQRRLEEAAEAFERAGMPSDALRVWREAGRWERALHFAEGTEREDLEWLRELERAVEKRPADLDQRLTLGERERLDQVASKATRV